MMGFIFVAAAVLSLLSAGQSAPVTDCETLIRPIEILGREQLLGNWMTLGESTDLPGSKLLTKMFVANTWTKVTAGTESDTLDFVQHQKMLGTCNTFRYQMTVENNTLSMERPLVTSETLLYTSCPDCLVVQAKYPTSTGTLNGLQLLSKRNAVTAAELEEYKKQVECLGLPAPALLNTGGLCPESQSQETQSKDITHIMNAMGSKIMDVLNGTLSREGGPEELLKDITSTIINRIKSDTYTSSTDQQS